MVSAPSVNTLSLRWQPVALPTRILARCASDLRRVRLRLRGARIGKGTRLGDSLRISGARGLDIGAHAIVGERCRIDVHLSEAGLARIAVGSGTILGPRNHVGAAASVEIGSEVLTAEGVTILDHDHDFSDPEDSRRRNRSVVASAVRIEDRVFLGERVVVLKGVTIGRCAVVGAHAVVTGDLPPYSMSVGAPARPIAFWDKELRAWRKA